MKSISQFHRSQHSHCTDLAIPIPFQNEWVWFEGLCKKFVFVQIDWDTWWTIWVSTPGKGRSFYFLKNAKMGSESLSLGTGALSYGLKWPKREAYHSLLCSVDVKNEWRYTFTSRMCIFGMYKDN
jgi:hypothetical protein